VTQEFHISVTPVGNDTYLVRTERVAPGVPLAEEQVVWSIEDWLAIAQSLMDDPLNGVLQGYGPSRIGGFELPPSNGANSALTLVDLGRQLYQALFQGTLRDSWLTAQGIAQHRGEALRLRLGLKGMRLPLLPWEVLQGDTIDSRPLATGTDVLFSRYQPNVGMAANAVQLEPLRILMAIAAPSDQQQLELQREAHLLQQELRSGFPEGTGQPDLQVTILEQPGREQLTQALEQGQYQIFHFAGHSDLGAAGGSLYLVNHRTGLSETLSGDDLAGLLVNNGISMAVFNSCRGAYSPASSIEAATPVDRNLAAALVNRGIPAVLAMAERIPDEVALTLTRLFYRNLKQGYPIDLSLSRARQGLISAYGSDQLYWALPILYLHPECDGYLISGDRSLENPADSLARLPHLAPSGRPDANWTVSEAMLSSDDLQIDDLPIDDLAIDDLEYADEFTLDVEAEDEDDRAAVSGILQELTASSPAPISATPPATSAAPPVAASVPVAPAAPARSWRWPKLKQRDLLLPLGAVGILTLAWGGFWLGTRASQNQASPDWLPEVSSLIPNESSANLARLNTAELTAEATSALNQNDLTMGEQAVIQLLDRGALEQARSALAAVPADRTDDPAISFLSGRQAWQAIAAGNPDYSFDDARRYWESAIQQQPNQPEYHQALGFAYYAEGKSREAIATWQQALDLLKAQSDSPDEEPSPELLKNPAALHAYAGMALALQKAASQYGPAERDELLSKAEKLYQMVMDADSMQFQPNALARSENWLWTEEAIADWQTLGKRVP